MAQTLDAEAFSQLNQEQKSLLDTVDKLRSQGVGEIVHLPQIIVVGDQSSGKSSVLEAISRVRFPVKGGLCTRFATELVVRNSSREEVLVEIRKDVSSQDGKKAVFNERGFSSSALPELIERAKVTMGVQDDANGFSRDILHIEVSGPDLPSLTLVDLPGIYRNETADQSQAGMATVWYLVEKYMAQKNSIILAVINASYDFSNQGILTAVKKHDPNRERTMGIITNPDRLAPKSIEESKYVRLIRNQEPLHSLKHGWHVLRNRGPDANDEQGQGASRTSDKERDETEKSFFSQGIWAPLSDNIKGIDSLRDKLSKVLTKHIKQSLPGVIIDIEEKLDARRETLARMGRPRKTPAELRHYLHDIAERFRDLTRLAVRGTYDDARFFGHPYAEDYPRGPHLRSDARRLRAIIRNLSHAFDRVIASKGAKREIIWDHDNDDDGHDHERGEEDDASGDNDPPTLSLYVDLFDVEDPEEITWAELEKELGDQASINQNTNFPGSPNDRLALNHFRDQSQRWKSIATMYLDLVANAAKSFVELTLDHITAGDEGTRDALLRECVDPFFEHRSLCLEEKLNELLRHYKDGEALTLESEFIRTLSEKEKRRLAQQVKDTLSAEHPSLFTNNPTEKLSRRTIEHILVKALQSRTSPFGLEKVVDMATVYYEMSLRTFTENVIILAAENCLVSELPSMLTSSMVHEMDEEMLTTLAAESPETSRERIELERDVNLLKEGLRICKRHRPRDSTSHLLQTPSKATTAKENERSQSSPQATEKSPKPVSLPLRNFQRPSSNSETPPNSKPDNSSEATKGSVQSNPSQSDSHTPDQKSSIRPSFHEPSVIAPAAGTKRLFDGFENSSSSTSGDEKTSETKPILQAASNNPFHQAALDLAKGKLPATGAGSFAQPGFGQPPVSSPSFGPLPTPLTSFAQPLAFSSAFGQPSTPSPAFGQPTTSTPAFGQKITSTPASGSEPASKVFASSSSNSSPGPPFAFGYVPPDTKGHKCTYHDTKTISPPWLDQAQNISFAPEYQRFSPEELRLKDYIS